MVEEAEDMLLIVEKLVDMVVEVMLILVVLEMDLLVQQILVEEVVVKEMQAVLE